MYINYNMYVNKLYYKYDIKYNNIFLLIEILALH